MLTVYFDESGTHNNAHVLTVAGYAATEKQWLRFDRLWRQFLDEERLPYLHMIDLVSRSKPYEKFSQRGEGRFLLRARFIIGDSGLIGVAAGSWEAKL